MQKQPIEISTSVVIKTILLLLGLWFTYLVRDIIALLIISLIFVSAIEPVVDWLQKKKVPRSASVLGIYLIMISFIVLVLSFLIPPIVSQTKELTVNYPDYSQKFAAFFDAANSFLGAGHISIDTNQIVSNFNNEISNFFGNIFSTTLGVFSSILSIVVVFSLTFYMSVEEDGIRKFIESVLPQRNHEYANNMVDRIKSKVGSWLVGQMILMLIIFVLVYVGLSLVGVPYALVLAIFAGFTEIIPYVGPIIAAVPGVVLGFLVSPVTGLSALLVYIVSQQAEGHIITPQVMKRAVGLNPITVIIVLLIGMKLAGVMGAILAIPIATVISLFVKDFMENWSGKKDVS